MACSHGCVLRQLMHSNAQNSTSTTLPRSWLSCSGLEFSQSAWLECVNSGAFGAACAVEVSVSAARALRTRIFMARDADRGSRRLSCPLRRTEGRHGYSQRLENLYPRPQIPGGRTVSDLLAGRRE